MRKILPLVLLAFLSACSDDADPTPPVDAPVTEVSVVAGADQEGIVGEELAEQVDVRLTTSDGSTRSGAEVTWTVVSGNGEVIDGATTVTNSNGVATQRWLLGPDEGEQVLRAAYGDLSADLYAMAHGPEPTGVEFSADLPTELQVGDELAFSFQLVNALGETGEISCDVKAFSALSRGDEVYYDEEVSCENGTYTVEGLALSDAAGVHVLEIYIPEMSDFEPVRVEIEVQAGSPENLEEVSAFGSPNVALGTPVDPLPVFKVTDAAGNPIAGAEIDVEMLDDGSIVNDPPFVTDEGGQASPVAWIAGDEVGESIARFLVGDVSVDLTINIYEPLVPTDISIRGGNNKRAFPGEPVSGSLIVIVSDQYDEGLHGETVEFEVVSGGGSFGDEGTTITSTTTHAGWAYGSGWVLGQDGEQKVEARVEGHEDLSVTFTAHFHDDPEADDIVILSGDEQVAYEGEQVPEPLVAQVRDQYGEPFGGAVVEWTVESGSGDIGTEPVETTSDGAGLVSIDEWQLGNIGENSVRATLFEDEVYVVFSATAEEAPEAASLSSYGGNGQEVVEGQPAPNPVEIYVTDQYNNPFPGAEVSIAVTDGGGSVSSVAADWPIEYNAVDFSGSAAATTDENGIATFYWIFGDAGSQELTSTVAGLASAEATTPGTAITLEQPNQIAMISGDGQEVSAGQSIVDPLVVEVRDQFNDPYEGAQILWAVTQGGGSVTDTASVFTNAAGQASFTAWELGEEPGENRIEATLAGPGYSIEFTATGLPVAANLNIEDGNNQSAPVGEEIEDLRVELLDEQGNPMEDEDITWSVESGTATITSANPTSTDASGQTALASIELGAGSIQIRAEHTESGLYQIFDAEGTYTATGDVVQILGGNNQSAPVGEEIENLEVRLLDQYGFPMEGEDIAWSIEVGTGSITSTSPTTTDAEGETVLGSVELGPTNNTIRAEHTASGEYALFQATGTYTAVGTTLEAHAGDGQTADIETAVTGLEVRLLDQYGNPMNDEDISWTVQSGGGSIDPAHTPSTTDTAGVAGLVEWMLGDEVGTQTVQAEHVGSSETVIFTVTAEDD